MEGRKGARGARLGRLERVSAYPAMPAMSHNRRGAILRKSKNSGFEILVVRFGSTLPFLAISCDLTSPADSTLRFLLKFPEIIGF